MNLDDLYRRVIMDHYKNPRNRGSFEDDALKIELNNPTCGDRITLQLKVEDGVVQDARFSGEGCSISMSSASMMTEAVKGQSIAHALEMADSFSSLMKVRKQISVTTKILKPCPVLINFRRGSNVPLWPGTRCAKA